MERRCLRNTFTPQQYEQHRNAFWAMPSAWGQVDGTGRLAALWREGRAGAISVLPVLGQYAHSGGADEWILSKEELSRLAGVDPQTVCLGTKALTLAGLVETSLAFRFGKRTTTWRLLPGLAAPLIGNRLAEDYFYFSSRLLYGGNWARLSKTQRAIYLTIGSLARRYEQPPQENPLLRYHLARGVSLVDFERCYEHNPERQWLRLACVSYEEIARASGVAVSAVKSAIKVLKHPNAWRGIAGTSDPNWLRYSPLAVYPGAGGALIYHLRDHVPHWPWEMLNQPRRTPSRRLTRAAVSTSDDSWLDEIFGPVEG